MRQPLTIKVPDIGDFRRSGRDRRCWCQARRHHPGGAKPDHRGIDKASMEIPASHAGVVKELSQAGRQDCRRLRWCSAGSLATGSAQRRCCTPEKAKPEVAAQCPCCCNRRGSSYPSLRAAAGKPAADIECDVLVLAVARAVIRRLPRRRLGLKGCRSVTPLGGVCLNVGCIPSRRLLHVAAVMDGKPSGERAWFWRAPGQHRHPCAATRTSHRSS